MELTKPKGRRDGKVADEILNAINWLDKAIVLNPNSIIDNYRKGKLIIDKQIENFIYSKKEWTKEVFENLTAMETEAIGCLKKCIEQYEKLTDEKQKKRYFKEYVKSLYCLGCYYIEKPKVMWNEYACSKLLEVKYTNNMSKEEIDYIIKAKEALEKCFEVEAEIELNIDIKQLAYLSMDWCISSMDKFYRLGLVYLHMFFVKRTRRNSSDKSAVAYGEKAEKYLNIARLIGEEYIKLRHSGRHTSFISEKLAWYYIINEDYDKAIKMIEYFKDSYIKNTYSIALMLSDIKDKFIKAETALKSAEADKYNKAGDMSKTLLAYLYKLSDQKDKYDELLSNTKEKLNNSSKHLISLIEVGNSYENR